MFSSSRTYIEYFDCDWFRLALEASASKLGSIWATARVDGEFVCQELFVSEGLARQFAYDHRLCRLATLHQPDVLVVSELRLVRSRKQFELKVLRKLTVPGGARFSQGTLSGSQVVLCKKWKVYLNGKKVKSTELILVDVNSGRVTKKFFPYSNLGCSVYQNGQLFYSHQNSGTVKISRVDF